MRNSIFSSVLAVLLAVCALTLGPWGTAVAGGDKLTSDTRKELAQARRATAKFHNIDHAYAEGYVDIGFLLPGVGCHLLNPGLVGDGIIDLTLPELLIYADCSPGQAGKAELRSIEYVLVCGGTAGPPPTCAVPAPEGFSGDSDVWTPFTNGSLWTLHVWVWRHNPDGIFVKINPEIEIED